MEKKRMAEALVQLKNKIDVLEKALMSKNSG